MSWYYLRGFPHIAERLPQHIISLGCWIYFMPNKSKLLPLRSGELLHKHYNNMMCILLTRLKRWTVFPRWTLVCWTMSGGVHATYYVELNLNITLEFVVKIMFEYMLNIPYLITYADKSVLSFKGNIYINKWSITSGLIVFQKWECGRWDFVTFYNHHERWLR